MRINESNSRGSLIEFFFYQNSSNGNGNQNECKTNSVNEVNSTGVHLESFVESVQSLDSVHPK